MLLLLDLFRDACFIYEKSLQGFGSYLPSSWSSKATLLMRLHKEFQEKYFKLEPTEVEMNNFEKELATAIINLKTNTLSKPKENDEYSASSESIPLAKFDVITNLLKICAECILSSNNSETAKNQFEQYKILFPNYFPITESSNYFIKKAYDFVCLSQPLNHSLSRLSNELPNSQGSSSSEPGYTELLLQKAKERIEEQVAKIASLEDSLAKLTEEQINIKEEHKHDLLHLSEKLRQAQEFMPENEDSRRQIKDLLVGIEKLQQENLRLKKQLNDIRTKLDKPATSSAAPVHAATCRNNNLLFNNQSPASAAQVPGGNGLFLHGSIFPPRHIDNPQLPVTISNLLRRYGPSQTS